MPAYHQCHFNLYFYACMNWIVSDESVPDISVFGWTLTDFPL